MSLVDLNLPSPQELKPGWAALAAVYAARGWAREVHAVPGEWRYHDGGGNWVCLRFKSESQAILIGHDHEYTQTYFRESAEYFQEEETNLLEGVPDWWGFNLDPQPFGEWVGFIYGWDGKKWQRAAYDQPDGFEGVALLKACSIGSTSVLKELAIGAPGLNGAAPNDEHLAALLVANGSITHAMLEKVVPGWDVEAGVLAAQKFT